MKRLVAVSVFLAGLFGAETVGAQVQYVSASGVVNHQALNRDCGQPAYSPQWSGLNTRAYAELTAESLLKAASFMKPFVQTGQPVSAQIKLAYVRSLVGGYGADAQTAVVMNYFCRLKKVYPAREAALGRAEGEVVQMLADIWDPSLSGLPYADFNVQRAPLLATARAAPQILTAAEVTRAIPDFGFDRRTTVEASVIALLGGATVNGCVGTGTQSIEIVDTRILGSLRRLRGTLGQYLSGQGALAAPLWFTAPREIYTNSTVALPNLTIADVTCAETAAAAVKAALPAPDDPA